MKLKTICAKVRDVAFGYRMGAGFPGDVSRTHPVEIEPAQIYASSPPTAYGQIVMMDATSSPGVRPLAAGDQSNTVPLLPFGVTVRSFPGQASTGTAYGGAALGAATPPTSGMLDILRNGAIMVQLNTGVTAPIKNGPVYIWCAATSGNHIQGGYETQYSAGNTVLLDPRIVYNGAPDANGVAELLFNI